MADVKLIPLEIHRNGRRGDISVMEDLPFTIKRVFCIYNVPLEEMRGGHAHKLNHQILIAVCGAVLVKVVGGADYVLDCPDMGLYVPPMHTIHLIFLTPDTSLFVLASEKYDRDDYVFGSDE
jgi:UDP-2-acetamido-3-amino-2,3-dideoxy-glucuronate N-acetyltransferase